MTSHTLQDGWRCYKKKQAKTLTTTHHSYKQKSGWWWANVILVKKCPRQQYTDENMVFSNQTTFSLGFDCVGCPQKLIYSIIISLSTTTIAHSRKTKTFDIAETSTTTTTSTGALRYALDIGQRFVPSHRVPWPICILWWSTLRANHTDPPEIVV